MGHYDCDCFVDTIVAREIGFDLNRVSTPYALWNSKSPKDAYAVFLLSPNQYERQKTIEGELYRKLSTDQKFVKLKLIFST